MGITHSALGCTLGIIGGTASGGIVGATRGCLCAEEVSETANCLVKRPWLEGAIEGFAVSVICEGVEIFENDGDEVAKE